MTSYMLKNGCTSNWIHANAIPAFRSFVVAHLWICLVKVAIVATCFDGCIKAQFKAIFIPHVLLWKIGARLVISTMTSWGFFHHTHTHKKETKFTNFMLYLCKYKMILSSTLNYMHFHSHNDGGGKNKVLWNIVCDIKHLYRFVVWQSNINVRA